MGGSIPAVGCLFGPAGGGRMREILGVEEVVEVEKHTTQLSTW